MVAGHRPFRGRLDPRRRHPPRQPPALPDPVLDGLSAGAWQRRAIGFPVSAGSGLRAGHALSVPALAGRPAASFWRPLRSLHSAPGLSAGLLLDVKRRRAPPGAASHDVHRGRRRGHVRSRPAEPCSPPSREILPSSSAGSERMTRPLFDSAVPDVCRRAAHQEETDYPHACSVLGRFPGVPSPAEAHGRSPATWPGPPGRRTARRSPPSGTFRRRSVEHRWGRLVQLAPHRVVCDLTAGRPALAERESVDHSRASLVLLDPHGTKRTSPRRVREWTEPSPDGNRNRCEREGIAGRHLGHAQGPCARWW
jgi:hypothetical protein